MTRLIRAEALRLASTRTYWLLAAKLITLAAAGLPSGLAATGIATAITLSAYHGATRNQLTVPPLWQLLAVLLGALLVITGLTTIPALAGARRPPAEILQAETA